MTKWRNERKPNAPIFERLGTPTKNFLLKSEGGRNFSKLVEWLDDSYDLLDYAKRGPSYEDYTFVITPAFKALERWIFLIAPSLGIPPERVERVRAEEKSVGSLIRGEELEKFFKEVLDSIETTPGAKDELLMEITSLKSFLKMYRHQISHCWKELDLPADAELHLNLIVGGIRRITEKLLEAEIIKLN